ncbi:hypothetical protein ABID14_000254 [Peptoniphilus olsenii]|uniref:Uncharacterized protein n=1 Tax=Peptoniphilus olsenii TaxID=411570 RepID=A0ABV2J788_9FIRM
MSYSNKIQNEILQKCYNNYLKTGIPSGEFVFGFDNEIRQNWFDTLDEMYAHSFIKPGYKALGMSKLILTESGLSLAKKYFE